jgi:hypothetical protein
VRFSRCLAQRRPWPRGRCRCRGVSCRRHVGFGLGSHEHPKRSTMRVDRGSSVRLDQSRSSRRLRHVTSCDPPEGGGPSVGSGPAGRLSTGGRTFFVGAAADGRRRVGSRGSRLTSRRGGAVATRRVRSRAGGLSTMSKRKSRDAWITLHRTLRLDPADVTEVGLFRITTPARTLADLCGVLPRERVEPALDDAVRQSLTTLPRLRWTARRLGGRGAEERACSRSCFANVVRDGSPRPATRSQGGRAVEAVRPPEARVAMGSPGRRPAAGSRGLRLSGGQARDRGRWLPLPLRPCGLAAGSGPVERAHQPRVASPPRDLGRPLPQFGRGGGGNTRRPSFIEA